MKKSRMKNIATLFIIAMLAVSLIACGSGQDGKTAGSSTPASTVPGGTDITEAAGDKYAPVEGKTYTITTCHMGYAQVKEDSEILLNYNKLFNVDLKPVFIDPNKYNELLNLKFASNEIPDIIITKGLDVFSKYQQLGFLAEVPFETIEKYAPDMYQTISEEAPIGWTQTQVDGKNYGIPYIVGSYKYTDAILWRDDWLKNVGIGKLPETMDEFEDAFRKFVKNDPDQNGKNDTYALSSEGFSTIFGAFGTIIYPFGTYKGASEKVQWKEKDGTLVYGGILPEAKEALKLLAKWYGEGLINPEFITGENKGGSWGLSHDFVNGRIGYTNRGYWYHWRKADTVPGNGAGSSAKEFAKINPTGSFAWGTPPIGPDGVTRGVGKTPAATGVVYCFSRNLNNEPDKLGKILQMFNWPEESDENWLFNWGGMEGKHYTMQEVQGDDGTVYKVPTYTEAYNTAEKQSQEGMIQFFYQASLKRSKLAGPTWAEYQEKMGCDRFGVENALQASLPSQSKYLADLEQMREEAYYKIIIGEKPIDYFDEFVVNWKQAGGEVLLKEADRFYKSLVK